MAIDTLTVDMALPELRLQISAKTIIMGAAASRDWQRQHHDQAWARQSAGLPDIIMNNYTQSGLISRYVTDWSGPQGRIGRMRFAMKKPICPGFELVIRGRIEKITPDPDNFLWVDLAVDLMIEDEAVTTASVRVAVPGREGDRLAWPHSPWKCPAESWRP